MALALDLSCLRSRQTREGAQTGALTVSLLWNDPSDLDLHAHVQRSGNGGKVDHIFYGHKKAAGGYLDVDMNVRQEGKGFSLEPVENIFWKTAPGGKYTIYVTNASTKSYPDKFGGKFKDPKRSIPFKVFLDRNGDVEEFEGMWKPGDGKVDAFEFEVEGSGAIAGTGGGGNYIVFLPEDSKTTFKELCDKHKVPWAIGAGYYAVSKKEKIQAGKEMLLQHIGSDNFTIGGQKCREMLDWPTVGELNKGPGDVLQDHRLFVQSTSANRVIPPGTHVLFEVDDAVYAKFQKTSTIEAEAATTGTAGMTAAAKAEAKAKAKAEAKTKAQAEAKAGPGPVAEQHKFLDFARDHAWDDVKAMVTERPDIVSVQPAQRWSALHQAAGAGNAEVVRFLLDAKAALDGKNKDGQTPLDVAEGADVKKMLKAGGIKRKAEDEPAPKAKAKAKAKAASLSGKKIVFTGALSTVRATAVSKAEAAGATVLKDVSGNMDILVAGPGAGAKMAKATGLGKEVWDEDKFKAAVGL